MQAVPIERWSAIAICAALCVGLAILGGVRFVEAARLHDLAVSQLDEADKRFSSDQENALEAGEVYLNRGVALVGDRDREWWTGMGFTVGAVFCGLFGIVLFATRRNAIRAAEETPQPQAKA